MSWEELEVLGWGSWYDCDCECGGFASEVGEERGVHGVENVRLRMGILPMTCSPPNSAPSTRRAATTRSPSQVSTTPVAALLEHATPSIGSKHEHPPL